MLLKTPNLIITPWEASDTKAVEKLIEWFYDDDYAFFFRHQPRVWKIQEFQNYPQVLNAEILVIRSAQSREVVGLAQINPDTKQNRAFFIGLLIDKKFQNNRYPLESFISIFDYCFNRLGFRKAIVEIVETHEGLKKIVDTNGFLLEGKMYGECFIDGAFVNELRYCMMDSFYNKKFKPILKSWGK